MEELKPCPFCGDNGIYDTNGKSYWVICAGCGARVAGTYFSGEKGKKIITERWNKRTFTQGHENDQFADVSKKDTISRQAAIEAITDLPTW